MVAEADFCLRPIPHLGECSQANKFKFCFQTFLSPHINILSIFLQGKLFCFCYLNLKKDCQINNN